MTGLSIKLKDGTLGFMYLQSPKRLLVSVFVHRGRISPAATERNPAPAPVIMFNGSMVSPIMPITRLFQYLPMATSGSKTPQFEEQNTS